MMGGTDINLAAIARRDPSVSRIIGSASQVALYTYVCGAENEHWEKTDIEGCLFIYERSAKPRYNFLIMNRQNPKDFIEPITSELEINPDPPYLFYRKQGDCDPDGTTIRGVWFYKKEECESTAQLLHNLIKKKKDAEMSGWLKSEVPETFSGSAQSGQETGVGIPMSPGKSAFTQVAKQTNQKQGGGDIMTLLSKAQSEYTTTKVQTPNTSQGHCAGTSTKSQQRGPKNMAASLGGRKVVRPTPVRVLNRGDQVPGYLEKKDGPEVLNTLFSQQASISDNPSTSNNSNSNPSVPLMPDMLQRLLSAPGLDSEEPSASLSEVGGISPRTKMNLEQLERDLRNEAAAKCEGASSFPGYSASAQDEGVILIPPEQFENSFAHNNESSVLFGLQVHNSTPTKSGICANSRNDGLELCDFENKLITPADLLSGKMEGCSRLERYTDSSGHCNHLGKDKSTIPGITPLTKEQMLQALTYMLQNDPSFVSQLHENYVKSLNESFIHRQTNRRIVSSHRFPSGESNQ